MTRFLPVTAVNAFVDNDLDAVRRICAAPETEDGPCAYIYGVLAVFECDAAAALRSFAEAAMPETPAFTYEAVIALYEIGGQATDAFYWRKEARLASAEVAREDIDEALPSLDTISLPVNESTVDQLRKQIGSVLERWPTSAVAWRCLAELQFRAGNNAAAEKAYRHAILYCPAEPEDYAALALVLASDERFDQAVAFLRRAEFLGLAIADSYLMLARLLRAAGRMDDAEETIAAAVRQCGNQTEFLLELATLRAVQNRTDEARDLCSQAYALNAEDGLQLRRALQLPAMMPEIDELYRQRAAFETEIQALAKGTLNLGDPLRTVGLTNFNSAYHGVDDRSVQIELAGIIRRGASMLDEAAPHCRSYAGPQGDRIRIGFVSSCFYNHTIAKIYADVVKTLRRDRFEVHVFVPPERDDQLAQYVRNAADVAHVLPSGLAAARDDIAACQFDAIVFPDIGMTALTYYLAFYRLAPVQAVGYGHPVTTGIDTVDYFLSSELWEPDDGDQHYSEKLVRFAGLGAAPLVVQTPATPRQSAELGLDGDARLYVCPQSLFKIHPEFDAVLIEILEQDADARLVLIEGIVPEWRDILLQRLCGDRPDLEARIRFLPRLSQQDFFALVAAAGVMLDTMHFSGGMTTLEALSMGTPVVTLPSAYARGRVTAGLLRRLGLDECIAADVEDYVAKSIAFASDTGLRDEFGAKAAANWHRIVDRQADVAEIADFLEEAVRAAARGTFTNSENLQPR